MKIFPHLWYRHEYDTEKKELKPSNIQKQHDEDLLHQRDSGCPVFRGISPAHLSSFFTVQLVLLFLAVLCVVVFQDFISDLDLRHFPRVQSDVFFRSERTIHL